MSYGRTKISAIAALAAVLVAAPSKAIELEQFTGAAHAYPAMLDRSGKKLANGEFTQQIKHGLLRIRITYDLSNGGRIEEKAVFQQRPELIQEKWSWRELKGDALQRDYKVDFEKGTAIAHKREQDGLKEYSDEVKIEPVRAFAGFGFTLAIENLRDRLVKGEAVELKAVGFKPKPQVVSVKLTYQGMNRVPMSGRILRGEHFIIRPEIPAIAKLFIKVPDTHVWLTPPPSGFLRWEGPLAEPNDRIVRVDLASGGESGSARAAAKLRSK